MNIAMLVHNPMTIDARVMREAATLGAAGHEVVVFALAAEGLPSSEQRDGYRIERVAEKTTASWRSPFRKWWQLRKRAAALVDAAVALAPDVVHCHDTDTLPAGMAVSRVTGARVVYDAHELFPDMLAGHGRDSLLVQAYWRRLEARLVSRADLVITVSPSIATILRERYHVEPMVVRNTPRLAPLADHTTLRTMVGAKDSDVIALYQGGLIGGRALSRLVEAVCAVDDVVLIVEGDGPEMAAMSRVATARHCEDRVRFMGWVAHELLHQHACGADIGVVIYENTSLNNFNAAPNKLYAYMMAGLPIASSDFPGLRDVVVSGGLGEVFDPMSVESISSALGQLARDAVRRREMSVRARVLAEERYNWEVDARILLDAYDRLGEP